MIVGSSAGVSLPFDSGSRHEPISRIDNLTIRNMEPCIIIHGGCRTIPDKHQESVRQGVKLAARKGYEVLLEVKRPYKFLRPLC